MKKMHSFLLAVFINIAAFTPAFSQTAATATSGSVQVVSNKDTGKGTESSSSCSPAIRKTVSAPVVNSSSDASAACAPAIKVKKNGVTNEPAQTGDNSSCAPYEPVKSRIKDNDSK